MKKVGVTGNGVHSLNFETVLKFPGVPAKKSIDVHVLTKSKNKLSFFGIGKSTFELPEVYGHPRYYLFIDKGEFYGAFHHELEEKHPALFKISKNGSPYYSIRLEWLTAGIMENNVKMYC